jgi:hypothetical protein
MSEEEYYRFLMRMERELYGEEWTYFQWPQR